MRKKVIFTLFAIIILIIVPLLPHIYLLKNFKILLLIVNTCIISLSQPAFSRYEMSKEKKTDKLSILIILIASSLSVFSSVVEWVYFTADKTIFNFLSFLGVFCLIAGTVLRLWSINILGKSFTSTVKIVTQQKLVTNGPYKYVRHPGYLGALIAFTGCPIFLNNNITIYITFLLMFTAYYFRIIAEEKILISYFGSEYENYKQKSFKMVPFLW